LAGALTLALILGGGAGVSSLIQKLTQRLSIGTAETKKELKEKVDNADAKIGAINEDINESQEMSKVIEKKLEEVEKCVDDKYDALTEDELVTKLKEKLGDTKSK
jgi:saccharopine dehydrogenase-like NADP-dependent oxidoreductase